MTDANNSEGPPRLGELLLNDGVLTQHELDQAIQTQQKEGGFLGEILVRLGFVKQGDVSSCLVKQCKIPHLSLLDYNIDKDVSELVPQAICMKYHLLPIDRMGKILTVAMVDPLDNHALEEVRSACPDLRIKPILCNWQHFELVASRVFGTTPKSGGVGGDPSMESLGLGPSTSKPKPTPTPTPPPPPQPAPQQVAPQPPPPQQAPPQQAPPAPAFDVNQIGEAIEKSVSHAMRDMANALTAEMHRDPDGDRPPQPPMPTMEQLVDIMRTGVGEAIEDTVAEVIVQLRAMIGQHANVTAEHFMNGIVQGLAQHRQAEEEMFQRFFDLFAERQLAAAEEVDQADEDEAAVVDDHIYEELLPYTDLTFDSFIGGKDNEFTLKMGQTVAREPGGKYNPVLLYGRVGVGKTHLMSAIANMALQQRPDDRAALITATRFAAAYEEAQQQGKAEEFRKIHAGWNMLLLDDVQGFEGRTAALEEFLHLLNLLHQRGAQIIIAGDKAPDALGVLGRQAMSRLSSGVVVELRPPTWEARVDILRTAAKRESVEIPDEVLKLISMKVPEDMRMMLGALSKVAALGTLDGQPITYETAENVLKRLGSEVAA